MKSIAVVLAMAFFVMQAAAAPVPGTSVDIKPPPGFVRSDRFAGFMLESTGSSIMVTEVPGPYAEVTRGLTDQKSLQNQGIKLLNNSPVTVAGQTAMLLQVEQSEYGTLFKKWILAIDRSGATTLIVASYPSVVSEQQEQPLRTAILNATFGKQTDPMDALSFTVKPQAPFKIAKVMGQALLLSPNGQFPVKDENVPFMIVGLSATEDLAVADKKAYAERRITQTATVKNIRVQQSTPVTIGSLAGYTTIAEGEADGAATSLTIYQVLLFDASGYCLMQGVTPTAKRSEYLPAFKKMAKTFRMKKPS